MAATRNHGVLEKLVPEEYTPTELNRILEENDRELIDRDVATHARHIQALISFSSKENISLPISRTPRGVKNPHVTKAAERIAQFIGDWYEEKYGDLLHYDFVLGELLAKIAGTYVVVRVPTVWGPDPKPTWDPDDTSKIERTTRKKEINIVSLINGITPKLARSATTEDIDEIYSTFSAGLEVLRYLDTNKRSDPLLNEVLNDFKASAVYFQNQNNGFGQSRWSSLQAVEKMLKFVLTVRDIKYERGHKLRNLADAIDRDSWLPAEKISIIQVPASIRYGEGGSTRAEAFNAHVAALDILLHISRKMDTTRNYDERS